MIPLTRFDPTALNILNKYIPLANTAGQFLAGHQPQPVQHRRIPGKVDHSLSDNQRLSLSYYETSGNTSIARRRQPSLVHAELHLAPAERQRQRHHHHQSQRW